MTLLPFLTDLRATYYDEYVTTVLYASANIACGMALFALWSYGNRQGLLRKLPSVVDRSMRRRTDQPAPLDRMLPHAARCLPAASG